MHATLDDFINYAFGEVASAFYFRYPNSFAKHIVSEDVLSREVTGDTITTRKLIVKKGSSFLKKVPKWMSGQANVQFMPTLEESVLDRRTGTLRSRTRNITHTHRLMMSELCEYRKMDDGRTRVERELAVSANCRFHGLVEKFLMMTFRKSVRKSMKGLNERLAERFGPAKIGGAEAEEEQLAKRAKQLEREKLRLKLRRDTA